MELHDLRLEEFNFTSTLALNIVDVSVDKGLSCVSDKVGPNDSLRNRVSATVGVRANNVRLNRLVLAVDEYLLESGEWSVEGVVPTEHHDAVIVELLNLLDGSELVARLKVVLAEESSAHSSEWLLHGISELERSGGTLGKLGVGKASIN